MEFTIDQIYNIAKEIADQSALDLTKEVLITTDDEFDLIKAIIESQVLIHFGLKNS